MNCELVMIGTELLLGHVVDTNASYLARRLADIGMNLYYKTTVGDNLDRMVAALDLAMARADVVITSGGLGPTQDDLTRDAVAQVLGVELEFHQELFDEIEARFRNCGLTMSSNNRKQAFLPEGATVIRNPVGTAPGFVAELENGAIITLPGVPSEFRHLAESKVLPYLSRRFLPDGAVIVSRRLKASGVGESTVDQRIGDLIRTSANPTVGILAQPGEIVVRLTARAEDEESASRMIDDMAALVRERIGDLIFGTDDDTLEGVIANLLEPRGATLCVVETGTAGAIAQRFVMQGTRRVTGFEVLPHAGSIQMFLSLDEEAGARLSADPASLAKRLGEVARQKYRADMALVVLEATMFGFERSWVMLSGSGVERLQNVGLKGRDNRSQLRLALVALEMTRRALLNISSA